ncbi:MAG: HAMP domain-containing sensor histidine kinase, partial [Gemmatimonas sp.]
MPVPLPNPDLTLAADPPEGVRRAASLERRLPLMISALLIVTITAFGFFSFSEVRQSSLDAANGQLRTIILQTGDVAGRTLTTRAAALAAIRKNPLIVRGVSDKATPAERQHATEFLKGRRTGGDTTTFVSEMLISASGERALVDGTTPSSEDLTKLYQTMRDASHGDSMTIGIPYAKENSMWYWAATAVSPGDEALGYVAELRRIRASPQIDQQLKGFTGQDISMYYAAVGADVWTGLRGVPIAPKFDVAAVPDSFHLTTTAGEKLIGVKRRLKGTPWYITFTINEDAVTARSVAFLRRMVAIGTVLLLVAMLGAWWVSRRVTEPLKSLTGAAQQIAGGNYGARELVRTTDELGTLAQAFNGMAERIGESHALLGARIHESETLARDLHQASQAKSEFLAMMSHELRTPLSAIAGYAEILQMGMRGKLNDAQQADLARIQANQVHLLRIINDILDIAQVESGQMQVKTQPVDVRDVVSDLEPIVLPLFAERNVRYSVHESVLPLVVLAERDRMTQVLVNLVANAIRFTEPGGNISIHASRRATVVDLHVTDTGIGIHSDKLEAIFQPFVQADSGTSRRAQGTGL